MRFGQWRGINTALAIEDPETTRGRCLLATLADQALCAWHGTRHERLRTLRRLNPRSLPDAVLQISRDPSIRPCIGKYGARVGATDVLAECRTLAKVVQAGEFHARSALMRKANCTHLRVDRRHPEEAGQSQGCDSRVVRARDGIGERRPRFGSDAARERPVTDFLQGATRIDSSLRLGGDRPFR